MTLVGWSNVACIAPFASSVHRVGSNVSIADACLAGQTCTTVHDSVPCSIHCCFYACSSAKLNAPGLLQRLVACFEVSNAFLSWNVGASQSSNIVFNPVLSHSLALPLVTSGV
jgi:hypothetical protein